MDSKIKHLAEQAGWMIGDEPEGFNTRLERFAALIIKESKNEIESLRQQNAELLAALKDMSGAGYAIVSIYRAAIAKATGGEL